MSIGMPIEILWDRLLDKCNFHMEIEYRPPQKCGGKKTRKPLRPKK